MNCSEWREVKVSDVIEMNPRLTLKKGTLAKKIAMKDLAEFNRKIQSYEITEFTSGTKFQNGDTLFARITPCLENGKTAYVDILEEGEVAFGSTEFIVLRAKTRITDDKFVYYLSISPDFRNVAIKSMTGSSGRQRVQNSVLANKSIKIPPLKEQKRIANILSSIDDKIELNNELNETLEEIAQAIFKHWFVDFEFPNENGEPYKSSGGKFVESELGMIPEGWTAGKLSDLVTIQYGKDHKKLSDGEIPVFGSGGIMRYVDRALYSQESVLIPRKGTLNNVIYINKPFWTVDTMFYTEMKQANIAKFVFYFIKSKDLSSMNTGSAVPSMTTKTLNNIDVVIPHQNILKDFESIVSQLFKKMDFIKEENKSLTNIRETLLPKLMSGEIRVPEAKEVVESCLQKSN